MNQDLPGCALCTEHGWCALSALSADTHGGKTRLENFYISSKFSLKAFQENAEGKGEQNDAFKQREPWSSSVRDFSFKSLNPLVE